METKSKEIALKGRNILKEQLKQYTSKGIMQDRTRELYFYYILTQGCNMNCPFCYQSKEFKAEPAIMTTKIIDDGMKFIAKNFDEKFVTFNLFGGEPFMRFDLIKYTIEKYPMFRYRILTNGRVLKENKEVYDWVAKNRAFISLSVSINALKPLYPNNYLEEVQPLVDLVNICNGDLHFVVDNPDVDTANDAIHFYKKTKNVRVSCTRHYDAIQIHKEKTKEVFRKIADYLYFEGEPRFGVSHWDSAFYNNNYRRHKGLPLTDLPPTFCGCGGYMYISINHKGDFYPCDYFISFPEMKMGNIYTGFDENTTFFKMMDEWTDRVYEKCANCNILPDGDMRLCSRALCLAENYQYNKHPFLPTDNHCCANEIEFATYEYIAKKGIELGIDEQYHKGQKYGKS